MNQDSLNKNSEPIGVLLAAGRGRRLGGRKQFYPWPTADGEVPLVAAAFDAVAGVCKKMIVVLGHCSDEVAAALGERDYQPVQSDPDAAMFESIRAGLQASLQEDSEARVLLHPADHPGVELATLVQLLALSREHPNRAIMPEFEGRGGHPVLIPAELAEILQTADCPQGLGRYWGEHPDACLRMSVTDSRVVRDIDTATS